MIYFMECRDFIKIGWAHNVRKRLSEHQISNPFELSIVGILDVPISADKALKNRFEKHKFRGEWFHKNPELLGFIAAHCAPGPARRQAKRRTRQFNVNVSQKTLDSVTYISTKLGISKADVTDRALRAYIATLQEGE